MASLIVEVVETNNVVVTLDKGIVGNGIVSVDAVIIGGVYKLNITYTNGLTELVDLPLVEYALADAVVYTPAGTGAVATNVQTKLRETVSVFDFMTTAQIADVKSGAGTLDVSAAIQAAITANTGKAIYFPPGTYIIDTRLELTSNTNLQGEQGLSILKLSTKSWPVINGAMFVASQKSKILIDALVFDGNKGNIGTNRNTLSLFFRTQDVILRNCTFQNVEGICVLASTDIDNFKVTGCSFLSCGGNPDNTDGYRKQAIAFDNAAPYRNLNVLIEGCYFYRQGLDCISIADTDNVSILNNNSVDSYSLLYNNPAPYFSTNMIVSGNTINNCSEFGAASAVPPLAFDLPAVIGLTIVENSIYKCDTAAIGVFSGSKNVVISNNVIIDAMEVAVDRQCGIQVSIVENVRICDNVIVDTRTPAKMGFGIVVKSDAVNLSVLDNVIRNPLTSRYGYYVTNAFAGSIFAITSTTQVSATTLIIDTDEATRLTTEYGRRQIVVNATTSAATISQDGTGDRLKVIKPGSALTEFQIDQNGLIGINVATGVFGSKFTLASNDTGIPPVHLLQYGNNNSGGTIQFNKTRAASPYAYALVSNGDVLGGLTFRGDDGTEFRNFAAISASVDGVAAAGDCPGRIDFATTPDGSATLVTRLNLKNSGQLRFIPQTEPGTAQSGDVYYDSGTNKLRCHNGTIWNDLF